MVCSLGRNGAKGQGREYSSTFSRCPGDKAIIHAELTAAEGGKRGVVLQAGPVTMGDPRRAAAACKETGTSSKSLAARQTSEGGVCDRGGGKRHGR